MDIIDLKYDFYDSSFNLDDYIIKIYAHKGEHEKEKIYEELYYHLEKTKLIFNVLLDEKIIKQFHKFFLENDFIDLNYQNFLEILDDMVYFHDISKISFNFQIKRLKIDDIRNILEKNDKNNILNKIESNHSFLSSLLYLWTLFEKFDFKKNKLLVLLAYVIYGHHTSIKSVFQSAEFISELTNSKELNFRLFLNYLDEPFNEKKFKNFYKIQKNLSKFLEEIHDKNELTSQISFFYSYIYSLMIKSDVIASSYYNEDIEYVKSHISDWDNKIDNNLLNTMDDRFNRNLDEFKNQKYNKLNDFRKEMMFESSSKLRNSLKNSSSKIFYLNLPTGGGKTNTSMKLALDILKNTDTNKIIYSMPFINIIDQNFDVIKNTFLGGNEEYESIRKVYSASESIFREKSDDDKSEILLKDDFFDYPIICTTFVSFFNSIIKNNKKYKYPLSSLANSVVILDEVQSLPLKNWTSLYYLINEISENYNIYFIIMSATIPSFDSLKINNEKNFQYNTVHLIKNPEKYFSHELFKRTKIIDPIEKIEIGLEDGIKDNFHDYFNKILSENFNNGYTKCLIVVNTVKTSKFIYQQLIQNMKNNKFDFDFELDLLNSTILSSERKKIIHRINNPYSANKADSINKNYILVSTQSVEAGVDVSFDFVIRDLAILDSIEQVRGRCNRSREINDRPGYENQKGKVYLVKLKRNDEYDYRRIYPNNEEYEIRFKETKKILENNLNYNYDDILGYYKKVSERINSDQGEKNKNLIKNDAKNIEHWNRCIYSKIQDDKINGIHLINEKFESYSFFVSTNQNICINSLDFGKEFENMSINDLKNLESDFNSQNIFKLVNGERIKVKSRDEFEKQLIFSINELIYLKQKSEKYKHFNLKLIIKNKVDGSEVLRLYKTIYKEIKDDINQKRILRREFSSILNKFIFQSLVFDFEKLRDSFNLKKFGFFYIINSEFIGETSDNIYSLKTGFNFDYCDDIHDFEIL